MKKQISILLSIALLLGLLCVFPASLTGAAYQGSGDVNADGSFDMKDILLLRKHIAYLEVIEDTWRADANGDGAVDMKDVLTLRRYLAGMGDLSAGSTTSTESATATETAVSTTPTTLPTTAPTVADTFTGWIQGDGPDQVTLTFSDAACTQYGVTWHTYKPSAAPVVQLVEGTVSDAAAFADATAYTATSELFDKGLSQKFDTVNNNYTLGAPFTVTDYAHKAMLPELKYGTVYSYRVGDAERDEWSRIFTFTTREQTAGEYSFLYFSDTQFPGTNTVAGAVAGPNTHAMLEVAMSTVQNPQFMIHGGDFIDKSYVHMWRNMLNASWDVFSTYPLMPTSGNHDSEYVSGSEHEIYKHFAVDVDSVNTDSMDLKRGIYYSFDFGDVHFVVLNTHSKGEVEDTIDADQYAWLEADLKANTKKWTVISMHHPMVYPRPSRDTTNLRDQLIGLFNEYNVDVVLQAHMHQFARSYPTDENARPLTEYTEQVENGVSYAVNPDAPIFVMNSSAGSQGDKFLDNVDFGGLINYAEGQDYSWMTCTVSDDALTFTSYYKVDDEIKTYDSFGVKKTDAQ